GLLDQGSGPGEGVQVAARSDALAEELHLAAARVDQPERHPVRRRLSSAVRAEEAVELAALDGQVESVDHRDASVSLREPFGPKRVHASFDDAASSSSSPTAPARSHVVSPCRTSSADPSGPSKGRIESRTCGGLETGNAITVLKHVT